MIVLPVHNTMQTSINQKNKMRKFAEVIGWFTIVFAILGAIIPTVEFRYCIAEKGKCHG